MRKFQQLIQLVAHGNHDVHGAREALRALDGQWSLRTHFGRQFVMTREPLFGMKPLTAAIAEVLHRRRAAGDFILLRTEINQDGYPLHSPDPNRLWFAWAFGEQRVNYAVTGNRIDGHSLLHQTKEKLTSCPTE